MNSVQPIKNFKTAVGLEFEERKDIKQLRPPCPNLKISKQNLIAEKTDNITQMVYLVRQTIAYALP
jgi:hypothetical protein